MLDLHGISSKKIISKILNEKRYWYWWGYGWLCISICIGKNKDLDVHLVEKSILGAGKNFFTVVTHTHLDQDTF